MLVSCCCMFFAHLRVVCIWPGFSSGGAMFVTLPVGCAFSGSQTGLGCTFSGARRAISVSLYILMRGRFNQTVTGREQAESSSRVLYCVRRRARVGSEAEAPVARLQDGAVLCAVCRVFAPRWLSASSSQLQVGNCIETYIFLFINHPRLLNQRVMCPQFGMVHLHPTV